MFLADLRQVRGFQEPGQGLHCHDVDQRLHTPKAWIPVVGSRMDFTGLTEEERLGSRHSVKVPLNFKASFEEIQKGKEEVRNFIFS